MTTQPEALRLADELESSVGTQSILPVIGPAAGVWIDCDDENGELTLLTGEDADAAIDAAMGKS